MARETGTVKWFSKEKGYGFIHRTNGEDIFVHHSDIEASGFRTLRQGESVEFDVKAAEKGPRATGVRRQGIDQDGNGTPRSRTEMPADPVTGAGRAPSLAEQIKRKIGRFFGSD